MNKGDKMTELTIADICRHYKLGDKHGGYFDPHSFAWNYQIETLIRNLLLEDKWSIIYQLNQVTFLRGKEIYSSTDFLTTLRKKLEYEKVQL